MESKECMRSNNLLFDRTTDVCGQVPKLGRLCNFVMFSLCNSYLSRVPSEQSTWKSAMYSRGDTQYFLEVEPIVLDQHFKTNQNPKRLPICPRLWTRSRAFESGGRCRSR
jgi:hypothetical protein